MAEKNLIGLAIDSILIGLVLMSLLTFYIFFVNNEGRGEIFDDHPDIGGFNLNLSEQYGQQLVDTGNINSNLSASYNPEVSISGADQVGNAISLNIQDLTINTWDLIAIFGSLIFGSVWTIFISGIILALISILFTYYTIRWIRNGT